MPIPKRLLFTVIVFWANLNTFGDALAQTPQQNLKRLTVFTGSCRLELLAGFFPCDPRVIYVELNNGRAFLTFSKENNSFTVSGGRDRQPNLENFYQALDTIRTATSDVISAEDNQMEGECHFTLNKLATKFYSIRCDIYNRAKGSIYKFYLENIIKFNKKAF